MPRAVAAILRHAHYHQPAKVPSAWLPYPLTDKGREQAGQCADELLRICDDAGFDISGVIDSSRMLRAWETASIIANKLKERTTREFAVEEFDALAERGVGAAANLDVGQIEAAIERDPRFEAPPKNWKATADYNLPLQGAESLREAGARVATHLEQRLHNAFHAVTRDSLKVFVGHGAAFRYAAVKLGVLSEEQAPTLSMFHCVPVLLERTDDGKWRHAGGEWKVRSTQGMD